MNPVFWGLIVLAMVFAWFVLSFVFPWLGTMFKRLWDDTMYNINGEKGEEKKDEHER